MEESNPVVQMLYEIDQQYEDIHKCLVEILQVLKQMKAHLEVIEKRTQDDP